MKNIPTKIEVLKGRKKICEFVKEDPKQILELIKNEKLPAWKRDDKGPWRALNIDLMAWLLGQRTKYLKDTPEYLSKL